MKFPLVFVYNSLKKLPFKNLSFVCHFVRKNHFQPKSHKFILKPRSKGKEKKLLHEQLVMSLQNCKTVEDQIKVFCSMINLPDEDIKCRYAISEELKRILQPYFPSCSVHLFGSSINGFGCKGCDVDLSLQLSMENAQKLFDLESTLSNEEFPEAENPSNKMVSSSKKKLLTIRKILQGSKYDEPLIVLPGRCPILNFTARNLSCDLSINNIDACKSTNLMRLCGKLDERVKPLMQIIIYWAKHSGLVGAGYFKFKTYAIFLMVIYFLQTRNPPVIPSIEIAFEKSEFLKNLENWSYDPTPYLINFEKSRNNQTLEELLREFFLFYGNYDFSHIICPLNVSSADRKYFASKIDCNNKFELNTICIQDPLDSEFNVSTGVSWKHCKSFLKAMISAWEICQDQKFWVPRTQHWGLAYLINNEFSYQNFDEMKEFSIDLPLAEANCDSFAPINFIASLQKTAKSLKHIFSYCLLFQCHTLDQDTKIIALEIPTNVRTAIENLFFKNDQLYSSLKENIAVDHFKDGLNSGFIIRYICATHDTWSGRNTYAILDTSKKVFDVEHEISKKMVQERGVNEKEIFYFLCECFPVNVQNNVHLLIKLRPLNNDKFIPKLAVFLREYVPKMMREDALSVPE